MPNDLLNCPICGGHASVVREPREIAYGRRRITVDDEFVQCAECREAYYLGGQMEATDRRASVQARAQGEPPLPFEIRNLRTRLRLPQTAFERLLSTGPKTAVRWELGQVIPNAATGALLRVLEALPQAVRYLAALNDVDLPPAYSEETAADRNQVGPQEFSVPIPRPGVIPIEPYLSRSASMQPLEAPSSSEIRTSKESTG